MAEAALIHHSRPGKVSEYQAEIPSKYSPDIRVSTEKSGKAAKALFSLYDRVGRSGIMKAITISVPIIRKKGAASLRRLESSSRFSRRVCPDFVPLSVF